MTCGRIAWSRSLPAAGIQRRSPRISSAASRPTRDAPEIGHASRRPWLAWGTESHALAVSVAFDHLQVGADLQDAYILGDGNGALNVVRQQLLLAGMRLAFLLDQNFGRLAPPRELSQRTELPSSRPTGGQSIPPPPQGLVFSSFRNKLPCGRFYQCWQRRPLPHARSDMARLLRGPIRAFRLVIRQAANSTGRTFPSGRHPNGGSQ